MGSNAISYSLYQSMPYRDSDFVHISLLATGPNVLVANMEFPATNFADFIKLEMCIRDRRHAAGIRRPVRGRGRHARPVSYTHLDVYKRQGIGWALTQRLSDMGCHVVGIARNTGDVDFPGYLYACDLADAGRTEEVLREIREKFPVDAVVNNVGIASPQPLGEIDLATLYNVLDLNVRVAVQVTQAFIESMKVRRAGRIVNVCSRAIHGGLERTCLLYTSRCV